MAVATAVRERVRGDLVRLVHQGVELEDFSRGVTRILGRAVPFDGMCLLTFDPATLLPTGEIAENALPLGTRERLVEIELREPDFNKFTALARGPRPAASLSEVTAGDLDRSLRQRELRRPNGFADELRLVMSGSTGTWGALTLQREANRPHFTPTEVRFVASLAGPLADGVRRATMIGDAPADNDDDDPGLLVLAADNTVEMANRAADRWLGELGADDSADAPLPVAVRTVASRTRRVAAGESDGVASARVHTAGGRWVIVRGSVLSDGPDPKIGLLLEAARPPELAPLIADAYSFTERERQVTELVAQGFSTSEIASRMHLSAYTVQDHLKTIFEKSGTGSRGELVARIFFDHYVPRLTPPERVTSREQKRGW
ncbi:MAG TPA: helix-turn-helix transcriptional regulator [Ilumatobacteraceae bacterium]|nr:helix-turn-helix transcriptional regulator [Ilumatobacteraceae bacterium]